MFDVSYGEDPRTDVALRINADHVRAAAFLIHDGVTPSNEGRGYVLRKIMRRAIRNARMIGREQPYLYELTGFVADLMKPGYPEMLESIQRVARVAKDEEHRYATTFQVAEKVFLDEAKSAAGGVLPGPASFKLYDTFGLALDEQEEMARERGLTIDTEGFQAEMEKQRTRARASWKGADKTQIPAVYKDLPPTDFVGRETLESPVKVLRVIEHDGNTELVFNSTPFYAEAGGQVGDTGVLVSPSTGDAVALVRDTRKVAGATVHRIELVSPIHEGDQLVGRVDGNLRHATMRNHTATHLLHAALRKVLGPHVKQAGSIVDPNRLRFDFTHYAHTDPEELAEIQKLVNEEILKNVEVHTDVMDLDQALSTGAMALFGEKYGDRVRVVSLPDGFSKELCGGTHVHRTGDIGLCVVTYEASISAGVRRIEAITGEAVLSKLQEESATARQAQERLLEEKRGLERQIEQMKEKLARSEVSSIESRVRDIKGAKVLSAQVAGMDREQLRTMVGSLRVKWKTAVVILGSSQDSNVAIVVGVTKDLTSKVHAGKLAGSVAQAVGGKGGGRPDMAEAGGKDPAALAGALDSAYKTVEGML
jgi:alanyl-tRNA synthetase